MIKYSRLRCVVDVARMEEDSNAFKILTGKPTEKRPLSSPGHDGRSILE